MQIVDGHVHTFMDDYSKNIVDKFNEIYSIPFKTQSYATFKDLKKDMNKFNINYSIIANFAPANILHNNNLWTLKNSIEHDERIPLVSFHPDIMDNFKEFFKKYLELKAHGIKLHPMAQSFSVNSPKLKPLFEACDYYTLPVVFHIGRVANARLNHYSDADQVIGLLSKYPNIPFVLTHLVDGNQEDIYEISNRFENVYFDTSIVLSGHSPLYNSTDQCWTNDQKFLDTVNNVGSHRFIFGSDYPWGNPKEDVERLKNMSLSSNALDNILFRNARNVYKITN